MIQEVVSKVANHTQHLRSLQQKAEEGTNRVANLEAALMVCKEELTMYIDQLEESKDRHEYEMDRKNKEVRQSVITYPKAIFENCLQCRISERSFLDMRPRVYTRLHLISENVFRI